MVKLVSPCTVPVGIEILVEPSGLAPVLQSLPVLHFPVPPFQVFCAWAGEDSATNASPKKIRAGTLARTL